MNLGCWLASQFRTILTKKNKLLILGSYITHLAMNFEVLDFNNHNLHLACHMEQVDGVFQFMPPGPIQFPPKRKTSKVVLPQPAGATLDVTRPSTFEPPLFSSGKQQPTDLRFQLHQFDTLLESVERQISPMSQNLVQYFHHVGFNPPFPDQP